MEQKDCDTYNEAEWLTNHLDEDGKRAFLSGYFKYPANYRQYLKHERCKKCIINCQVKQAIENNEAEWLALSKK